MLHIPLDIKPGTGGDSVSIVEEARRRLERHPARREFVHKLVLLDQDRVEQDIAAGRDAAALAVRYELEITFQEPDLEGLLCRLHPGQEQRHLAAGSSRKSFSGCGPSIASRPLWTR